MPTQSSSSSTPTFHPQFIQTITTKITLLVAVFMMYLLPEGHCTFQRTDWQPITTVVRNGFTVCGVDIGPIYADLKSIYLWTYDSVNITNGGAHVVSSLACSKYGHLLQRGGDPVYLAVLLIYPIHIRLFKITDGIKLEEFDYFIQRKEYVNVLAINLERDRLFVLHQRLNTTGTFVDVFDLSSK